MMLRSVRAEEHDKMVKESQAKYIANQVDLFERIVNEVEKSERLFGCRSEQITDIAIAIYQGYCLTDVEDAIRGLE